MLCKAPTQNSRAGAFVHKTFDFSDDDGIQHIHPVSMIHAGGVDDAFFMSGAGIAMIVMNPDLLDAMTMMVLLGEVQSPAGAVNEQATQKMGRTEGSWFACRDPSAVVKEILRPLKCLTIHQRLMLLRIGFAGPGDFPDVDGRAQDGADQRVVSESHIFHAPCPRFSLWVYGRGRADRHPGR